MDSDLAEKLDSHFFNVMKGSVTEPLKYISDAFDVSEGLRAEELLIGKNIGSLEYLFTVSAIAFASETNAPVIHPVISIPSVDTHVIFDFLLNRFETYASQDTKIKFFPINGADLVGRVKFEFNESECVEVPRIIKWRMENEEKAHHTALFLINNVNAISQNQAISLKEILSELSSISSEASFIIFLKPSAYNFVKATLNDDEFQSKFSRFICFDGFNSTDITSFKTTVENRMKMSEKTREISLDRVDLNFALTISRGIPYYAFKIIEEDLQTLFLKQSGKYTDPVTISLLKNKISDIWKNVDSLTSGQIDILTALSAFPHEKANIYDLQERMKQFRKSVGNRTAILQQVRKLYENELLDRDRPIGSREVYYNIKPTALPAIEYKIKEYLIEGK